MCIRDRECCIHQAYPRHHLDDSATLHFYPDFCGLSSYLYGLSLIHISSQEVAGALRIWRFLLALLASAAGLFGVVAGLSALVIHLAGIESFGVSYLTPFASNAGEQVEGHAVFRQPLPRVKQRPAALKTRNRRNQV